jgi:predicted N-acetyltransferase YhbS
MRKRMAEQDLVYRPLSQDDGQRINELYERAYGKSRSLSQWCWEYRDGPFGEPLLWGAESGGRLVGHYALIPFQMSFQDGLFSGAKAESAMVDPSCRGRGICSSLVELTLQEAARRGIRVVWGFPNNQSFAIMQKSGRRHVGVLNSYMKIFRPARVLRAYLERRIGGWIPRFHREPDYREVRKASVFAEDETAITGEEHLLDLNRFDERLNRLWERVRRHTGITIVRNEVYLNWRFVQNPHGQYKIFAALENDGEICGYMISTLKREMGLKIGYIVDFLVSEDDTDIFHRLLFKTLRFTEENGADIIYLFLNREHRVFDSFHPVLTKLHFRRCKSSRRFAVKIFPGELSEEEGYNPPNWYLTGAFAEGVEF